MNIDFIEICGFRGIKDTINLEFSSGSTIISGRNGVGKSTICDAIEFAISGEINKYRVNTSDKENLSDYVWWRGDGDAKNHYVKLGFVDAKGMLYEVMRSREAGLEVPTESKLENLLCDSIVRPEAPLEQLCKTSIIRDELISSQSLDLKETERFDFVSAALGQLESKEYKDRISEVIKIADDERKEAEKSYEDSKLRLSKSLS